MKSLHKRQKKDVEDIQLCPAYTDIGAAYVARPIPPAMNAPNKINLVFHDIKAIYEHLIYTPYV